VILLQGCYLKTATDCTYVYFILSSVFYVIVAVCQLLIKDFLILILILILNVQFVIGALCVVMMAVIMSQSQVVCRRRPAAMQR